MLAEKNRSWIEPSLAKCEAHFPWVADYKDRSITELEWVAASMVEGEDHVPCFFLFRDERYDRFVLDRIEKSKQTIGAVQEYSEKLDTIAAKYVIENDACGEARGRLLDRVRGLAADGKVKLYESYPHPQAGVGELAMALRFLLKQLLPERFSNREEKTHNAIKSYLSSSYVPLHGSMEAIFRYTDTSDDSEQNKQPMFVYGGPGSGKSAFLAHVAATFDKKADWCVLYHHTSSNANILSTLGRLGDKVITLLQNPAFFHKIGSWLKYKKAFDSEQSVAKQRKILTSAMRKVTTHFNKALHEFGGKENDEECVGEFMDSIYDSIAVMGSSRTLEAQTTFRLSSHHGTPIGDGGTCDSLHNTTTNTTLSAKTLTDHEMYQRALNLEMRASFHVEDRKRQLLILIDDFDALTFGNVDKDAIPYKLDFPAIVSLIARMILPCNVKIICSVSEAVLESHMVIDKSRRSSEVAAAGAGPGAGIGSPAAPENQHAQSPGQQQHAANGGANGAQEASATANGAIARGSNGGGQEPAASGRSAALLKSRDMYYIKKKKQYITLLKGNTFGTSVLHKKYYRLVELPCPVFKMPELTWSEATAIGTTSWAIRKPLTTAPRQRNASPCRRTYCANCARSRRNMEDYERTVLCVLCVRPAGLSFV